jgi:hypothetical protein
MRVQTYVAAGALVLAGTAIAWGATRATDTGVIHACADARTSALYLAPASGACATNQTPIQWNVQGPQGLPGPQGPAGNSGDVFDNGGGGSNAQFPLHVLLAAPGIYSVTASAQVTKFFATPSSFHFLLARCTLTEPRGNLAPKLLRRQFVVSPSNYTGNFAEPVNMNAIVNGGTQVGGRKSIVSVYFSCFLYKSKLLKGVTVSSPSLTAIRLGP